MSRRWLVFSNDMTSKEVKHGIQDLSRNRHRLGCDSGHSYRSASPDMAMPTFLEHGVGPLISSVMTLFILFAMKSTANSLMHTVSTALSYDLRSALGKHKGFTTTMTFNRLMVLAVGIGAFVGMAYLPPVMILWLGILGNGTLMASLFGVTLCSTFWQGNALGAFTSIAAGFGISAYLLLGTDLGWVQGPLYGCLASAACYVGVSLATRRMARFSTPVPERS